MYFSIYSIFQLCQMLTLAFPNQENKIINIIQRIKEMKSVLTMYKHKNKQGKQNGSKEIGVVDTSIVQELELCKVNDIYKEGI